MHPDHLNHASYTEYLCDPDAVRAEAARLLLDNPDIENTMRQVISGRLAHDPRRYLDYGPYWPALRQVLGIEGDWDGAENAAIAQVYCGDNAIATMLMADDFRSLYLANYARYTNQFILDADSGTYWTLFDPVMEAMPVRGADNVETPE